MKFLALFAAAMVIATLLMAGLANAYAADVRPKPKPDFDCWVDENGQIDGCRIKENDK